MREISDLAMRRAGIFWVRARVGLEKVGFELKSSSGLHYNFILLIAGVIVRNSDG